ncbi:MAG: hypothetical protein IPM29_30155 [Planctomycetes bacterium]|nr:hypothetical protein [Planctomycetota bacterium]
MSSPRVSRAAFGLLGGAIVLAIALVSVLGDGSGEPRPLDLAAASASPGDAALAGEARSALLGATRPAGHAPVEAAARTAVEPVRGTDGPRLTVVDAATSLAVAGAEVFLAEERVIRSLARWGRGWGAGWLERLEDTAQRVVADAAGQVRLPPVEARLFVAARSGGLFGVTTVQRDDSQPIVRLVRDETLTVRVVDGRARPRAGVEVALAVDRLQRLELQARGTSDENGLVVLSHVQLYRTELPPIDPTTVAQLGDLRNRIVTLEDLARLRRDGASRLDDTLRRELGQARDALREMGMAVRGRMREQREVSGNSALPRDLADFVIAARSPQLTPHVLRVPADAVPERILELRIGDLGAVVVRLVGPDGEPLWTPCRVELARSGANPLPGTVDPALVEGLAQVSRMRADKPVGEAEVRFAPVGAGVLLDVAVRFADDDFAFEQKGLSGPLADEERVLEVAVPDWFAVLTGRLVGPDGKPWSELATELLVSGARGRIEGEPVTTDSAGRFELPIRLREPAGPYALEVQARLGEQPLGALVAVPDLQTGRRQDIGDVLVVALPLLAKGTIVDDRGEPITGASAQLQQFLPGAAERGDWRDVAYVRAITAEDGAYALYGQPRDGELRVRAMARGYTRAESGPLPFGATFDATLARLGGILAAGIAPDWLPRGAVQVELLRDGRQVRSEDLQPRQDGAFRTMLGGLPPGIYDLTCTLTGIGELFAQPGIVVAPGDTVRLPEVDLRDAVFRYEVRAVGAAGRPLSDPGSPLLAQVRDPRGQLGWAAFPWRGDRVEFYSSSRSASVVVLAAGHRPARAEIAPGETTLTVVPLQPIELSLPGLRGMVGDAQVRISLVYEGDTGLPMEDLRATSQSRGGDRGYQRAALGKSSGAWLGDNDVVRMPLMLDGRYRAVARIAKRGQRERVSVTLGFVDAVVSGSDAQRVTVAPPPAVVQQALIELQSR